MGVADLVPGVSGGTIAFITGIYNELVTTIAGWGPQLWRVFQTSGWRAAWAKGNFNFAIALAGGVVTSALVLSGLINTLLQTHSAELWGFFFGLVVASVPVIARRRRSSASPISWYMYALSGGVAGLLITSLPPLVQGDTPLFLALAGSIAACAMILPGISGSFILLILGAYEPVIRALDILDIVRLAGFAAGVGAGLLAFSRLLRRLLARYHDPTIGVLTGFLAGSAPVLWPWRAGEVSEKSGSMGALAQMEWPADVASAWAPATLIVVGVAVGVALGRISRQNRT